MSEFDTYALGYVFPEELLRYFRWSRKLGQRFRNYKLRNYEKDQTRIQFSVQS